MPKISRVLKVLSIVVVVALQSLLPLWGWSVSVSTNIPTQEQAQLKQTAELTREAHTEWNKLKNDVESQLARIREFAAKVASAPRNRELVAEASKLINEAAEAFERLAARKEQIKASLLEKVRHLEAIPSDLDTRIAALQQQKAQWQGRLQALSASKAPEDAIRIRSTKSFINDLEIKIKVLTIFRDSHGRMLSSIKDAVSQIDLLIVAIEENAAVFNSKREALATILSVVDAASLVKEVPEFASLTKEVQRSWDMLDSLMKDLTDAASEILSAATGTKQLRGEGVARSCHPFRQSWICSSGH